MGTHDTQHRGLGDAARRELQAEQQRLRADRLRIVAELNRIEQLLTGIDGLLANGSRAKATTTSAKGLRDSITEVLRENPEGLRPIEVSRTLEARGYRADGSTAFPTLVSNQLWRMANREGVLTRSDKTGKYMLPRE